MNSRLSQALSLRSYGTSNVNGAVAPAADLIVCQLGISIEITMGVLWTVKVCRNEEGREVCDDGPARVRSGCSG